MQSAITISEVAEPYIRRRAMRHLEKGRVVIFAAGTGNPFFTTDTAAALRALEIHAEAILMAKNDVEGVYTADPRDRSRRATFLAEHHPPRGDRARPRVMDSTALSLCMDNDLPIYVFNMADERNIDRIVCGERVGTVVATDERRRPEGLPRGRAERMAKSVEATRGEFATVRTGRASPHLLDRVSVDYYGAVTPLKPARARLGARGAPAHDHAVRQVLDQGDREGDPRVRPRATPSNDGNVIRLAIPELTEERRKELVKVVHGIAEEGRVAVRNIRRDCMHDLRELQERGRGRRGRGAPRRGRAAEAHRRQGQRDRRAAEG